MQYGSIYDCVASGCTVVCDGSYAGGITGIKNCSGTISRCKVYGCTVLAETSYAGGIIGYSAGILTVNSVSNTTVSAADSVGGLAGYVLNSSNVNKTTSAHVYYNVVSGETTVTGKTSVGGLVGAACGSNMYYNEIDDEVTVVSTTQDAGGLAGYLSGGILHHNIVAASVDGVARVGGLVGEMVGYGTSSDAGAYLSSYVAKAYSNIIASDSITGSGNYVAGLIGLFDPGSQPVDGDGNVIEDSGYEDHMCSSYFYANVIAPQSISGGSSTTDNWYANYTGNYQTYQVKLPSGESHQYDAVGYTLLTASSSNTLDIPISTTSATATALVAGDVVAVDSTALGTVTFYTNSNANGGIGFSSSYINTSDVTSGYYPYVRVSSGGRTAVYQTSGSGNSWDTYYTDAAIGSEAVTYTGTGIPIEKTSGASLMSLASTAATVSLVYTSGINTINVDFTDIDTSLVTFEIPGYVEKTEITSLSSSAYVCSFLYDFQTDFEIVLYTSDGTEAETYSCEASALASTVMSWNGNEYYIKTDGVYLIDETDSTSECVLSGSFVHLYEGQALSADGTVYDLSTLSAVGD